MLQYGDTTTIPSVITPALRRLVEIQFECAEEKAKAGASRAAALSYDEVGCIGKSGGSVLKDAQVARHDLVVQDAALRKVDAVAVVGHDDHSALPE